MRREQRADLRRELPKTRLDVVSPAEVGLYTVGAAFLTFSRVPADAVTQVALPRQAAEDELGARDVSVRVLRLNLLLNLLLSLIRVEPLKLRLNQLLNLQILSLVICLIMIIQTLLNFQLQLKKWWILLEN